MVTPDLSDSQTSVPRPVSEAFCQKAACEVLAMEGAQRAAAVLLPVYRRPNRLATVPAPATLLRGPLPKAGGPEAMTQAPGCKRSTNHL